MLEITQTHRPITEAVDELARELDVRDRCYDRWVADKKLSRTDAKDRMERMLAALGYLAQLAALVEAGQVGIRTSTSPELGT